MEKNNEKQNSKTKNEEFDIYSEDNLLVGAVEENDTPQKSFDDWYKVKIKGKVDSYLIHDDGSLQCKFVETIQNEIDGVKFDTYEDRSIRIRLDNNKKFSEDEVKQHLLGKAVEIINVVEKPQFKKLPNGEYDFNKIEGYFYSANNVKPLKENVPSNFQLYKIFEMKVSNVAPCVVFNKRKRAQEIDKDKSVLFYTTSRDTLNSTHSITIDGLNLQTAKTLVGKELIVLDLKIINNNYYASKIKKK